jgi:protein O-GlcNAc transferase
LPEKNNLRDSLDSALKTLFAGDHEAAGQIYRQILENFPDQPEALYYLGLISAGKGENEQAVNYISRSVAINPLNIDAFYNLGIIKRSLGDLMGAAGSFRKLIELSPGLSEGYLSLSDTLIAMGKGEEAIPYLEKAVAINPDILQAHYNLGIFAMQKRNFSEAENHFRKALELKPDWAEAYTNLGNVLKEKRNLPEALHCYLKALEYNPDWTDVNNNIGSLLIERGLTEEAALYFRKVTEKHPDDYTKIYIIPYSLQFKPNLTREEWQREMTKVSQLYDRIPSISDYNVRVNPKKKLKIGYISPDFCKHSCSWFIEPLFTAHNRNRVEINCFSLYGSADKVTERLTQLSDKWFEIRDLKDPEAVELILKNKIDILVDLAGQTANNRLTIFARKPAPVQVTWLGFPASTGLKAIDYRISDHYLTPEDTREYYTEKIWNLNRLSHCYKPPEEAPAVGPLPYFHNGYITFGSFNVAIKLGEQTLELWSLALQAVTGSRLLIKVKHGNDEAFQKRIFSYFNDRGIESSRIDIHSFHPTTSGHLDYYNRVDIGLDTFPYNGATTTLEALWMGVPVITQAGDRTSSRYGYSFLNALNLKELAPGNHEDYVKSVKKLAENGETLAALRSNLRRMMLKSEICDWKGFARELEAAYQGMWKLWCASRNNS